MRVISDIGSPFAFMEAAGEYTACRTPPPGFFGGICDYGSTVTR
jgi:hypothetical protein